MEGDSEANLCYYALHKLNKFPSEILNLDMRERAFIYACILLKSEIERKSMKK